MTGNNGFPLEAEKSSDFLSPRYSLEKLTSGERRAKEERKEAPVEYNT